MSHAKGIAMVDKDLVPAQNAGLQASGDTSEVLQNIRNMLLNLPHPSSDGQDQTIDHRFEMPNGRGEVVFSFFVHNGRYVLGSGPINRIHMICDL